MDKNDLVTLSTNINSLNQYEETITHKDSLELIKDSTKIDHEVENDWSTWP